MEERLIEQPVHASLRIRREKKVALLSAGKVGSLFPQPFIRRCVSFEPFFRFPDYYFFWIFVFSHYYYYHSCAQVSHYAIVFTWFIRGKVNLYLAIPMYDVPEERNDSCFMISSWSEDLAWARIPLLLYYNLVEMWMFEQIN